MFGKIKSMKLFLFVGGGFIAAALAVMWYISHLNGKVEILTTQTLQQREQIRNLEDSLKLERAKAYVENVILTDNREKITEVVYVTREIEIEVEREVIREIQITPKDEYNPNVARIVLDSMWKQYHCATGVHRYCTTDSIDE